MQDTCIRHGNYDEALDLESFVGKLAVSHAADVPVVRALGEGAKESSDVMLAQLLGRLEGAIQLPECLRIIGYLRRMAVLSEVGLRRTFLRCRERFIASAVKDLDTHSPYDYIKRLTDLHRVHLFDVVMQYRAIFADDSSASDDGAALTLGGAGGGGGGGGGAAGAGGDGGLLYSWSTHRVSAYLHALETALPRIEEGGALASVGSSVPPHTHTHTHTHTHVHTISLYLCPSLRLPLSLSLSFEIPPSVLKKQRFLTYSFIRIRAVSFTQPHVFAQLKA